MIKQGSLKSEIVAIVREMGLASCAQILEELERRRKKEYDASHINTLIYWMIKEEQIRVAENVKGPKGGRIYTIGERPQTKRLVLKLNLNATSNH